MSGCIQVSRWARVADVCVFWSSSVRDMLVSFTAPMNDLNMLKLLASLDSRPAKAALKKLCGQLWQFSEKLVTVSFFNQELDARQRGWWLHGWKQKFQKRIPINISNIDNKLIHHFVTKNNYKNFLHILSQTHFFKLIQRWGMTAPDGWMAEGTVCNFLS